MKIGLDLRGLDPDFKAHSQRGTGRYIREVTDRLLKNDFNDESFSFIPLTRENIGLNPWQRNLLNRLPRGRVTFESQICLRNNIKNTGCDVAHFFSHGDAPAYPLLPQIATILDLIPLKFPHLYQSGPLNLRFKLARFLENRAAIAAKGIITISEASKRDIVEILGIPAERIAITYLGVDDLFFSNADTDSALSTEISNKLKSNFPTDKPTKLALYVGGLDARKNIGFLLNLVKELNENLDSINNCTDFRLALVGNFKNEKNFPEILKRIETLGLKDKIIFLGFVGNTDLIKLYKNCDIFIFPSLYEGFGLPILEAMASESLIVAGNNSCMKEVLGDDNFLFQDNDLKEWSNGIIGLLNSKDSGEDILLEKLKANKVRAKLFNWENTVKQTIEAYNLLLL